MDVQWVSAVGTIASALILLLTLPFLAKQTRDLVTRGKSDTYRALIQNVIEYHKSLIEHPEIEKELFSSHSMGKVQRHTLMLFNLWENLCVQYHEYHTVDDITWRYWEQWIKDIAKEPAIQQAWGEVRSWYGSHLRILMET